MQSKSYNPDHAGRIYRKNRISARLLMAVSLLIFACSGLYFLGTLYAVWQRVQADNHQNQVFAKCLNGEPVALGNAILRCKIVYYNLVDLSNSRGQP